MTGSGCDMLNKKIMFNVKNGMKESGYELNSYNVIVLTNFLLMDEKPNSG